MSARIIIEGWRHAPTSYAVLNQFQLLEMLRRPGLEVYHKDLPYWHPMLQPVHNLFPPEDQARLDAIPAPPPNLQADAVLRIAHPTDVAVAPNARKTFVWIATDFGILEASRTTPGITPRQALNTPGIDYITCSKWSFDGLIRSGGNPSKISIVPCGIDPKLFCPLPAEQRESLRRELGWQDKFVFLNVSTLVWSKGIRILLTAFAYVAQRFPNAFLALKGSTEWLQPDRRLQENLDALPPEMRAIITPRLLYLGDNLSHERLAQLYNAADAYAHPYHAEGFCIPVLEAAACGLPVIVSSGGSTDDFTDPCFALHIRARPAANAELVKNHGEGAQVLLVDGDHLVELMSKVITDPGICRRAREEGPRWVQARFTWKHVVDKLLELMLPPVHPGWLPDAPPARQSQSLYYEPR